MKGSKRIALRFLILVLMFTSELTSWAQLPYRFWNYSTANGLAFEESRSIIQDSLGFIWIQHLDGLSRFDGYEFVSYKYNPDDSARNKLNILLNGIHQDQSGNIFISGSKRFLKYNPATDGFISAPPIDVNHVWQDLLFDPDENKMWICTFQKGLFLVEGQERKVTNYFNPHSNPKTEAERNDMNAALDMGSSLLIATLNGLWLFDKNTRKFERPKIAHRDTTMLYKSFCLRLFRQSDGTIWLHRMESLKTDQAGRTIPISNVTGLKSEFVKLDASLTVLKRIYLPEDLVFNRCVVSDDIIWLGNQGKGLYRIDANDDSVTHIRHNPTDPYSIPSNVIRNIFIDQEKNVWVGTNKGISILRYGGLEFNNMKLSDGSIDGSTIYRTKDQELLILSMRSSPVMTSDNINTVQMAPFSGWRNPLQFSQLLTPIKAYTVERFWIGKKNFWLAAPGSGVFGFPIEQQTGRIQFAPIQSLIHDPENKNTLGHRLTTQVLEDEDETLWVANKRTGLDRINSTTEYGTEGSVTNFRHSESDSNSVQEDGIYYLFPEDKHSMWILTETSLDLLVKRESGKTIQFKHILVNRDPPLVMHRTNDSLLLLGTTRGLYEVHKVQDKYSIKLIWNKSGVTDVQEDQHGRLWIYGSNLLGFLDRKKGVQIEFRKADGIDHTGAYNPGHMHQTQDGTIILVDHDGVSAFDPLTLQINDNKVRPVLTNLKVNNYSFSGNRYLGTSDFSIPTDIQVLNDLIIDYRHNNFTIEFSSMEMTSPEKNLYRHKLEGYDNDWIETDAKNRTVTYTNLDPGTYTFRVKASNNHGVWSDNERTLKVIILPPPWRTWWAYTGYGLLVVGLLYWARRNIVQRERLKANLALEKVEHEKEHFELEKAKEVDKIKTSFFTNISHEFRTPLTLIKGPVETLLDKYKDDPEAVNRLKLVQRNSDLLLRLINQLLDLAKLESGNMKIEKSKGNINSFINAIASSFHSLAGQKQVNIHVEVLPVSHDCIFDKDKLETILINLINNAIKFTPAGGTVTIAANLTPVPSPEEWGANGSDRFKSGITPSLVERGTGGEVTWVRLSIRDTGIGIPPEHQTKIFERFHQVSEAHKEVGTGVGLALVKELVSLLGGTISVKSKPGEGSEFVVTLPIELAASHKLHATSLDEVKIETASTKQDQTASTLKLEASSQNEGDQNKPHILVVEDNDDLRAFIIDSLGNEFYFLEADNGRKGLEKATSEIPDLIISDVMMPEMDGITMAEKIKKDIRTSHVPLILLTAKSTEDSKLHGLESGADDYLTKPFNKHELLLKVRNAINRQLKLRERLRAELMSTAPKVAVLSTDEVFLNTVKETILKRLSDERLSVESLAESMNMSRVHLYRKVSALTGLTVNELIRKLRLQRAAQLLNQKWGPVSQVAYEVGFSNLSYFSKIFKEEFNALPSDYH